MDNNRKTLILKLIKTMFLILVWVSLGLASEITGVTLQDLRERTGSDYEQISQAVAMRMTGMGVGALFGGWLMTKLTRFNDLILALSLTIGGILGIGIAYTTYVQAMYLEFTIQGIAETFIAIAGQQSLIKLWKEKSDSPMHILHCGYGAGSFLVPQIVKPFLSTRVAATASSFYIDNCFNQTNSSQEVKTEVNITEQDIQPENNNFEYGYLIVTAIEFVIAGVFYIYFWFNRKGEVGYQVEESQADSDAPKTTREMFSFNSCSPGHPWYAAILFGFLVIWFYIAIGGQMVFANYLYSYTRDLLCVNTDTAANIQTGFWVGFTAGRFAGFVVAIWIPMKVLTFLEAGGNMVSALVLYFSSENVTIIWIFACVSGFFVGPLYPTGIAWANRYITLTGVGYTLTLLGGAAAGVSFTVAIGWFFENTGPQPMLYFVVGYSALACSLAIFMHLVARTRGDKYERERRNRTSDTVELSSKD
ncbi:sodium-dependent glucose transporter 1A-like [Watersipora subatra]|uniref:sodium-dependent glucose transporter 1A-like n=1 Tax=Watersipora subatra TaxID=2589382 RepID=UPI00355B3A8A